MGLQEEATWSPSQTPGSGASLRQTRSWLQENKRLMGHHSPTATYLNTQKMKFLAYILLTEKSPIYPTTAYYSYYNKYSNIDE